VVAWQWLKQGNVAAKNIDSAERSFYQDKIHTMKFFYHYEVPKALGLTKRLLDDEILTIFE